MLVLGWGQHMSQADLFRVDERSGADVDGQHRYGLWRRWSDVGGLLCWIMLNTSTADATSDDATVRRCCGFAKRWGLAGIEIVNLFAYRATNPGALTTIDFDAAVGERNDRAIEVAVRRSCRVIAAWGNSVPRLVRRRAPSVIEIATSHHPVHVLTFTKDGHPVHPLRQPYRLDPLQWYPRCKRHVAS